MKFWNTWQDLTSYLWQIFYHRYLREIFSAASNTKEENFPSHLGYLGYYCSLFLLIFTFNRTTHIRHQWRITTVLSCHRCLINTGMEKNEQHLNIDKKFDPQMSLRESKCWYSDNCSHFKSALFHLRVHSGPKFKKIYIRKLQPYSTSCRSNVIISFLTLNI